MRQTGMRVRPEKQAYVWQQAALVRQILSLELQLPTWIPPDGSHHLQRRKGTAWKDSFQEIDIAGVAMPITKYSVIVKDITVLADTLRRAFSIAKSGRPGPVLVDITKDVTAATYEYEPKTPEAIAPSIEKITEEGLDHVISLIRESEKTVYFRGRRQHHLRCGRGSA